MDAICYRCGEHYHFEWDFDDSYDTTDCIHCGERKCVFTHQEMADILNNLYVSGVIDEQDIQYDEGA